MTAMRILVTAGPTREAIDAVRFISNRSSGRMGYAIAACAAARAHEVRLVSGPVALGAPARVAVFPVLSAADMLEAVTAHVNWCDALVMAAAVADWRPRHVQAGKIKKHGGPPHLDLEPTADILAQVRPLKGPRIFVGFAAETGSVRAEAERKLHAKGLDLIVANDVSRRDAGFDVETNQVTLLSADGAVRELPLLRKDEVAAHILDWIERHAAGRCDARAPRQG